MNDVNLNTQMLIGSFKDEVKKTKHDKNEYVVRTFNSGHQYRLKNNVLAYNTCGNSNWDFAHETITLSEFAKIEKNEVFIIKLNDSGH